MKQKKFQKFSKKHLTNRATGVIINSTNERDKYKGGTEMKYSDLIKEIKNKVKNGERISGWEREMLIEWQIDHQ